MNKHAIALPALVAAVGLTLLAGQPPDSSPRGLALYHGTEALKGKIRGHDETLPPEALRCSNCHEAVSGKLTTVGAPHLDRSFLLDSRQRRGGPPSRYDAASLCKLLRTGVDPAFILVAREMPVYELNEEQCDSLWTFLTGKVTRK